VKIQQTPIMRRERKVRAPGAPRKSATRARPARCTLEDSSARRSLFPEPRGTVGMDVNRLAEKVVARMRDHADALAVYDDTTLGAGCPEQLPNGDHYILVEVNRGDGDEVVVARVFDKMYGLLSSLSTAAAPTHVVYYDLALFKETVVDVDSSLLLFMLCSARGTPPLCVVVPEPEE
jgi:hypothetical protein